MSEFSIGNDIVDLRADEQPVHPRFAKRVFSEVEQKKITNKSDFWLYWAAKEAAYKMLKRLDPELIFSPIKFTFNYILQTVSYQGRSYPCQVTVTEDYVSVVAATSKEILNFTSTKNWLDLNVLGAGNESQAVRTLAVNQIARCHDMDQSFIKIMQGTIPHLQIGGKTSTSLLSFSHHGRYVFCSYCSA